MHQFGNRTAVFPATPVPVAAAARGSIRTRRRPSCRAGTRGRSTLAAAFGVLYSYASGDKNARTAKSETFQNLFATTHLHYGYMDLNSLQNLHDFRLAFTPSNRGRISRRAGRAHAVARSNDRLLVQRGGCPAQLAGAAVGSGGGYRINPSYSSSLGTEIDLVAGWTFMPSAQIEVGVSHYFRGDYIKQSLAAVGSKDASYVYVQLTLNL